MATTITVKEKRRGPQLSLNFTVVSCSTNAPGSTDTINVNDLALVQFTFELYSNTFMSTHKSTVKFKKTAQAESMTVIINLTCEGINNEWICQCQNDWIEMCLGQKKCDYSMAVGSHGCKIYSTNIDVNIKIHDEIANVPMQANKLFEDTVLTDFQLRATDGVVEVHKALLAVHSDMFMTMLSGQWKETEQGCVKIDGATKETLEHLKRYIYLGTLPDDGIGLLLVIATRYMMNNLKTDCIKNLVETATPEKLNSLVEFACANNLPDLMRAILFNNTDTIITKIFSYENKKSPLQFNPF